MEKLDLYFFTMEGNIFFSVVLIIAFVTSLILLVKLIREPHKYRLQQMRHLSDLKIAKQQKKKDQGKAEKTARSREEAPVSVHI